MQKSLFINLIVVATSTLFLNQAKADNPLSQEQLIKATQAALLDYSGIEAEMVKSLSGFKVTTVGTNAQVILNLEADGMHMSAKYLCLPQGADMICHIQ
jgi:hypothetical protein